MVYSGNRELGTLDMTGLVMMGATVYSNLRLKSIGS
jgi:hypothetical protein